MSTFESLRAQLLDQLSTGLDPNFRAELEAQVDAALAELGLDEATSAAPERLASALSSLDGAVAEDAKRLISVKQFAKARDLMLDALLRGVRTASVYLQLGKAELSLRDLPAAEDALLHALALDADDPEIYRALATVYENQHRYDEADTSWLRAFPDGEITRRAYAGTGRAPRVLVVHSAALGNVRYGRFLDKESCEIIALIGEAYRPHMELPEHDVVFQAVGDAELCPRALAAAREIKRRSAAPFLNEPDAVERTSRVENAARFAHIANVRTPLTRGMRRSDLLLAGAPHMLKALGFTFPLLLRTPGLHTGEHFEYVEQADDLAAVAGAMPGDDVLVMEYLDTRASDGTIRKYRVMYIGGELMPLHLAVSHHWKVHYFAAEMERNIAYRQEEERFLYDMPGVLGERVITALREIFAVIGLDYCGIDFTVDQAGNVVFFEANATMAMLMPNTDPKWEYRRAPIRAALDAAKRLVLDAAKR